LNSTFTPAVLVYVGCIASVEQLTFIGILITGGTGLNILLLVIVRGVDGSK
jgi:hypothetical protein